MSELNPIRPIDERVISRTLGGVTIGSDGEGHVHHPPESAPVQTARIVHLLTTDEIEGYLWSGGYTEENWDETYEDILVCNRWKLSIGASTDAYAYSILFGDGIDSEYITDVKRHAMVDRCPVSITATR